jgi:uncharacterized membrane protein
MKNNQYVKWLASVLTSVAFLLIPARTASATNNIKKISQITKNTQLILQPSSVATAIDLAHASHSSHSSHASHASHASHYSSSKEPNEPNEPNKPNK